jgi:hypothetical protein
MNEYDGFDEWFEEFELKVKLEEKKEPTKIKPKKKDFDNDVNPLRFLDTTPATLHPWEMGGTAWNMIAFGG